MGMLVMGASYCLMHLGHWPALRDYARGARLLIYGIALAAGLLLMVAVHEVAHSIGDGHGHSHSHEDGGNHSHD